MSAIRDVKSATVQRSCKSADYTWNERVYEQHRTKVRDATHTVNVKEPERRPHVLRNAKRSHFERERQARIARENFILFKRLTDIMNGKSRHKHPLTQPKTGCIKVR